MRDNYDFSFADVWLSDLNGVTTARPPHEVAEYDFELVDIPGKSGSEYIDNKRYKNVIMTREIGILHRSNSKQDKTVDDLIDWLAYNQGYHEFSDSDHPYMIAYAALTNFAEVSTVLRRYHKARLKFSRHPFWYHEGGLEYTTVPLTDDIPTKVFKNPYKLTAKPLIEIVTTGGSPTVIQYSITTPGGIETAISCPAIPGNATVVIDLEKKTSKVEDVYAPYDVPEGFEPGVNTFKLTIGKSRVSSIRIMPRWRCL